MTTTTEKVHQYFTDQWDAASQYAANRRIEEILNRDAVWNVRNGITCLTAGHLDEPGTLDYTDEHGDWHTLDVGWLCAWCDRLTTTDGTQLIPAAQS